MRTLARYAALSSVLVCALCSLAQQSTVQTDAAIRGWLSDEQCARGRAESGSYTGTNPRCAKECVAKGKKIVLIDPERKKIFDIANQGLAKKNIGDYVEIVGETNLQTNTIQIASVRMLERGAASCERPKLAE